MGTPIWIHFGSFIEKKSPLKSNLGSANTILSYKVILCFIVDALIIDQEPLTVQGRWRCVQLLMTTILCAASVS